MRRSRWGGWCTALALGFGLLVGGSVAQAQLPSLIKKKVSQATASVIPAGASEVYSAILLELKADRLQKVIAGKQVGNAFGASAAGPAALREKHQAAVDAVASLRNRNTEAIDAWEERLRQARGCAELRAPGLPTAADSASVTQACGLPAPPAVYTRLVALQQAADQLERQVAQAEAERARLEETTSGMDRKQLGIACERILLYLSRLKAKQAQSGFSAAELEALDRRVQDLDQLCR